VKSKWKNENQTLVTRIETVERSASLLRPEFDRKITDASSGVTELKTIVQLLQTDMNAAKDKLSHVGLEFPLKEAKSVDGIISCLTRKYNRNVHDTGIVTITSKSVRGDDPRWGVRNVADLSDAEPFWSKDEPAQWICWDFHEIRVRPTHYTIRSDSEIVGDEDFSRR
jgi:hypothetical protein